MKEITVKYRNNYMISSKGTVTNIKTGKVLKQSDIGIGYKEYRLGASFRGYAHRIIYDAFYGLKEGLVIDHINGDRSDNRLENLQQITQSENVRRGSRGKHKLPKYITRKPNSEVLSGFTYSYRYTIDGKRKYMYGSCDLDSVISFKYSFEAIVS